MNPFKQFIAAFCLTIFVAPANSAGSYALTGRVVEVADGDTIALLAGTERRWIRLASIDAPETKHGPDRPGQPYGQASRRALADLVAGKTLRASCFEKDRFQRDICDIVIDDTTANQLLVKAGLAWANQQGGGKFLRDRSLVSLEAQARDARLGLWSDERPLAPWVWRWRCWKEGQC